MGTCARASGRCNDQGACCPGWLRSRKDWRAAWCQHKRSVAGDCPGATRTCTLATSAHAGGSISDLFFTCRKAARRATQQSTRFLLQQLLLERMGRATYSSVTRTAHPMILRPSSSELAQTSTGVLARGCCLVASRHRVGFQRWDFRLASHSATRFMPTPDGLGHLGRHLSPRSCRLTSLPTPASSAGRITRQLEQAAYRTSACVWRNT